jgi:hypothetical protein
MKTAHFAVLAGLLLAGCSDDDKGDGITDAGLDLVVKPDSTGDMIRPDQATTDGRFPDKALPDMPVPDQMQPDQALPDMPVPDLMQPDQALPDMPAPDQMQPDQMQPDQMLPDMMSPDQSSPPGSCTPQMASVYKWSWSDNESSYSSRGMCYGSGGETRRNPELALDPAGNVHLVFQQKMSLNVFTTELVYTHYSASGGWASKSFSSVDSSCQAIGAISASDVHILYVDSTTKALMHLGNKGGTWATTKVEAGVSCGLSVAVGGGLVGVAYTSTASKKLRYAQLTKGKWTTLDVAPSVTNPSLVMDSTGSPTVAAKDKTGIHVFTWSTGGWTKETVDTASTIPHLSMDAQGIKHLAYAVTVSPNNEVRIATRGAASWSKVVATKDAELASFTVDKAGKAYLAIRKDASKCSSPNTYIKTCTPSSTVSCSCSRSDYHMLTNRSGKWATSPLGFSQYGGSYYYLSANYTYKDYYTLDQYTSVHRIAVHGDQVHMAYHLDSYDAGQNKSPCCDSCWDTNDYSWSYKLVCLK